MDFNKFNVGHILFDIILVYGCIQLLLQAEVKLTLDTAEGK